MMKLAKNSVTVKEICQKLNLLFKLQFKLLIRSTRYYSVVMLVMMMQSCHVYDICVLHMCLCVSESSE